MGGQGSSWGWDELRVPARENQLALWKMPLVQGHVQEQTTGGEVGPEATRALPSRATPLAARPAEEALPWASDPPLRFQFWPHCSLAL